MSIEELGAVGLERMDEASIEDFLRSQGVGVLALSADPFPYMIPLSFGYGGGERLYFSYALGETSRKEDLSDSATGATFLVYDAPSAYTWRSVLVSGAIEQLPPEEWEDLRDVLSNAWHPDIFEEAPLSRGMAVYALSIEEVTGLRHTGLPAQMARTDEDRPADPEL